MLHDVVSELWEAVDSLCANTAQEIGRAAVKCAGAAELSYGLAGRLFLSRSGWLLLKVPNAMGQGALDALQELGVELPVSDTTGRYEAHISVMRADEVEKIGANRISELGHTFHYTLGPVRSVVPGGWAEMARVWFIECRSPELEQLRRSYGLPSLPTPSGSAEGYPFHITFAVRRKGVLRANGTSKAPPV